MRTPASLSDIRLSWRNLGRNRKRTFLAWMGIAVAQITLVWMSSFINGYDGLIFEKMTGPMIGHIQIHAAKYRDDNAIERTIPQASEVMRKIAGVPHVVTVLPRVYGPVLATVQELGHVAMVTGLNIADEIGPSRLLEGTPKEVLPGSGEVLIGKALAGEMSVHKGDVIALMGQGADGSIASGLYKVKDYARSDVDQINRAGILMGLAEAQDFLGMNDQVHEITIHVDEPKNIPAVVASLRSNPAFAKFEILDWKELVPQIAVFLEMTRSINFIILVLVFLTTSAGIANTMLMATFERSHEFGMLLALGCKPSRLVRILLLEAVFLGVSGVMIGSIIGVWIVSYEARHGINLAGLGSAAGITISMEGLNIGSRLFPVLDFWDVFRGILAVIVTSMVASFWPAHRISKLEPVEAMRA